MTTFNKVILDLKTASHPVARSLHTGDKFKVLVIGFNKGMMLKDHQTHVKSILTVLNGSIIYREGINELTLNQYDEIDIPINIIHSVEGLDFSICLLTQGR